MRRNSVQCSSLGRRLEDGLYLDLVCSYSASSLRHWTLDIYHLCIRRQDCYMGDIGGVAQAGASVLDTTLTNQANEEMQRKQDTFSAQQAGIQRDWTAQQSQLQRNFAAGQQVQAENYNTQMSNTAMQRRVADLKAAGLNPMIAATSMGGGASAPTMSAPTPGSPGGGAAAQAPGIARMQADPVLQGLANLKLTNAQAAKTSSEQRNVEMEGDILTVQTTPDMLMKYSQALENKYNMSADEAGVVAQTKNLLLQQTLKTEQEKSNLSTQQAGQLIQNNILSMDAVQQRALLNESIQTQQAILHQQGQEADNIAAAQSGVLGKTIAYLQAIASPVNTAAGAANQGASAMSWIKGLFK